MASENSKAQRCRRASLLPGGNGDVGDAVWRPVCSRQTVQEFLRGPKPHESSAQLTVRLWSAATAEHESKALAAFREAELTYPLVIEFAVQAPLDHAFAVWTERCATWWPPDHTISQGPASVTFEPRVGGRVFERGPDGAEHEWGQVVAWEPPTRVAYRWHLFLDPSEATDIEVTFRSDGATRTVVRLEHRGWERLGDAGPPRRAKTGKVWGELSALFGAACAANVIVE